MAAEEQEGGYRWETEYEKTWEAIREDDDGLLQGSIDEIVQRAKRKKLEERPQNVRLGMMRHLFIIIDMSETMGDQDLKPTRIISTIKLLEYFIDEFFDQNPISQLGIIITRNKRAEKISELGGNPKRHIECVKKLKEKETVNEPSLQNALDLAAQTLRHMPSHASREILVILGSLTTCDPGDIGLTIKNLKDQNIRCSVIGLAAEVRVCKKICHDTKGTYNIILDETHFKNLLGEHVIPPPSTGANESSLIRMGFPHHQLKSSVDMASQPSMCMCHLDTKGHSLSTTGYFCPQCKSKYCELPVECKSCGLTLVSAPHLARSYHHLFPLPAFKEMALADANLNENSRSCYGCQELLTQPKIYQCGKCNLYFCLDCDLFVHDSLHSCPGCASSRGTQISQPVPTAVI